MPGELIERGFAIVLGHRRINRSSNPSLLEDCERSSFRDVSREPCTGTEVIATGCRSRTDESGGMTVDGIDLIGERNFASIGCREY